MVASNLTDAIDARLEATRELPDKTARDAQVKPLEKLAKRMKTITDDELVVLCDVLAGVHALP